MNFACKPRERGEDDDPFFSTHDEKAVRAYFDAAHAFYRARPWERIDGEKYVAFRLGDGPWGYLSVLGQMGEEFGLSYFEDWLQLCRFVHNQYTPLDFATGAGEAKPLVAAGALEGLTLEPLHALHPEDIGYLQRLGVKPYVTDHPANGRLPEPNGAISSTRRDHL